MTRQITIVSSAGARALADACTAWAEKNKLVLAMAVIDWGGNVLESHAMEGAAANAIETALLKARSALRWRRPTSETNKLVKSGRESRADLHERLSAARRAADHPRRSGHWRDGRLERRRREVRGRGDRVRLQRAGDVRRAIGPARGRHARQLGQPVEHDVQAGRTDSSLTMMNRWPSRVTS